AVAVAVLHHGAHRHRGPAQAVERAVRARIDGDHGFHRPWLEREVLEGDHIEARVPPKGLIATRRLSAGDEVLEICTRSVLFDCPSATKCVIRAKGELRDAS